MKKLLIFFTLISIIYANEIGKLSLVKGDVNIQREQNIIKAKSGDIIYNKDIINTSNTSKAQIRFKDGTIVTLGKNTNFSVNNYIYEQDNKDVNMSVDNGSFKVITGSIGKLARDNFKFKANSATIGIRGTIFAGNVSKTNNVIACVEGAIVVSTKNEAKQIVAGKMVEVVNNKLGDIKPLQTKDIETISSLDSKKLNEDTKLSSNEDNKSNNPSLNLATNDTTNQTKQASTISSNQAQNSSSNNQTVVAKVTEQSLEDIKKNQEEIKKLQEQIKEEIKVSIPMTPLNPANPINPPTLNDKNNSVFYYSGVFTCSSCFGENKIDDNAKAKVDYISSTNATLNVKHNLVNAPKNTFNFNNSHDGGYFVTFTGNDGTLKISNSKGSQTGAYDRMDFSSGFFGGITMEGSSTTKSDFDNH